MGKQQDQVFQDQIAFLVKREKYTLQDFHDGLKYFLFANAACVRACLCMRRCQCVRAWSERQLKYANMTRLQNKSISRITC